jgi:hypothetical protein
MASIFFIGLVSGSGRAADCSRGATGFFATDGLFSSANATMLNLIHHMQQTIDFTGENIFCESGGNFTSVAQNCAARTIVAKRRQHWPRLINDVAPGDARRQ